MWSIVHKPKRISRSSTLKRDKFQSFNRYIRVQEGTMSSWIRTVIAR